MKRIQDNIGKGEEAEASWKGSREKLLGTWGRDGHIGVSHETSVMPQDCRMSKDMCEVLESGLLCANSPSLNEKDPPHSQAWHRGGGNVVYGEPLRALHTSGCWGPKNRAISPDWRCPENFLPNRDRCTLYLV